MNKKERVMATFAGLEPDRTPTGFWMHFPKEYYYGDAAVKKHLEYFEKTQTDICKVMTEYMYPCDHRIKAAADWQTVHSYNRDADFIRGQADITRGLRISAWMAVWRRRFTAWLLLLRIRFWALPIMTASDAMHSCSICAPIREPFPRLTAVLQIRSRSGAGGGSCGRGGHLLCSTRWRGRRLY